MVSMASVREVAKIGRLSLKRSWFIVLTLVVYIFFSAYYMGPGFTNCTDSIYGFGDSTAGPIWRNSLKPAQPLFGGSQTNTNYPYGESLFTPVSYAASVQTVVMAGASKVVGPMCAYNLYNIIGYVLTGVIMCLFILYLTRNKWVALLAGYAVSFAPYIQSKVGGHPSYGYAAILIGLLWLFLHLVKTRNKWVAAAFGVLLAVCAYFDPYFTLLAATIVGPAVVVWILLRWRKGMRLNEVMRRAWRYVTPILIATIVFILCLAPIAIVRIKNASAIEATVSKSRGDIKAAAMQCSNTPLDYLLPDPTNIHLVAMFGQEYTAKNIELRHWCGSGESRVSVSLTLCTVLIIAGMLFAISKYRKRSTKFRLHGYDARLVIWVLIGVGFIAVWLGMPPRFEGIPTLSAVVLKAVTMWRIFAREFLVVNIALVSLAAIALAYLLAWMKQAKLPLWSSFLLVGAIFIGVLFEYQINNPFSPITFSYDRDVPKVYRTVRDDQSIEVIAEYPLDRIGQEHDSVVYYMTMQAVHGKKIFNSVLANDSKEAEHISLKDLTDPQTIPALRYLGIRNIVIHGESVTDIQSALSGRVSLLQSEKPVVYSLQMVRQDSDPTVALLRINEGPKLNNILAITKGYAVNLPNIQSPLASEYELLNGGEISIRALQSEKVDAASMCMDVKMAAIGDSGVLTLTRNGKVAVSLPINNRYSRVSFIGSTGDVIRLTNDRGFNMRVNNLDAGCGESL